MLATGDDEGKIKVYRYPCTIKNSEYVEGLGHGSNITNVYYYY
jgi:hypothetical protein